MKLESILLTGKRNGASDTKNISQKRLKWDLIFWRSAAHLCRIFPTNNFIKGDKSLSAAELARQLDVPANRISQIVAGKRNITADTALRLGRYFGTTPDFWMNLQKTYELDLARAEIGATLERLPQRTGVSAL